MAASSHEVFLSHSSKDKEFVKELYRRLKRDGVRCFFDIESIGWGDNWVRALERAIDECTYIVFVLSPMVRGETFVRYWRSRIKVSMLD
jgi:TIR domain